MRRGFAWTLGGSLAFNLSQWCLIWVLARAGDVNTVGTFTLLLALTAPIFLTVGLNLRTVQITDATRRFSIDDFMALRLLTNMVGVVVCVVAGGIIRLPAPEASALSMITIARCVENYDLSYYGYFGVRERFDLVAKSLLWRAVLGPILFGLTYWWAGLLWPACLGLVVAWWLVARFDRRRVVALALEEGRPLLGWRGADPTRMRLLLRSSWPLGVGAGVNSGTVNVPRYGVEVALGTSKLGIFAGQAYLAQVLTTLTMAMAAVFVPKMSRDYFDGRRTHFVRALGGLAAMTLIFSVLAAAVAVLLGEWFLTVTLGPEYADTGLLVALMVASGFVSLQRVLSKGLEASHRFRSFLAIDTFTLVVVVVCIFPLMDQFGVIGAAAGTATGFATGALAMLVILVRVVREMPNERDAGEEREFGD